MIVGEAIHVKARDRGEFSVLFLNFSVNLKLLENNKILFLRNEAIYKSIKNINFLGRNQTKGMQDHYPEKDKILLCVSH